MAGAGILANTLGSTVADEERTASEYVLTQGDECTPIQPLTGDKPVEAFYDYRLPERFVSEENGATGSDSPFYASVGTTDLQRPQTSIAFLYQGPNRLSLVVVHGSIDAANGGSVTFRITGLPQDGRWSVKDDLYRDSDGSLASSNYDRWDIDGTDQRIDWTWGSSGTDGGAFAGLGDDFEVVVKPAFNESAALYNEYYEGTVTDWEFLSGVDGQERIALNMSDAIRIATGTCDGDASSGSTDEEKSDDEDDDYEEKDEDEHDDKDRDDDEDDEDDEDDDYDEKDEDEHDEDDDYEEKDRDDDEDDEDDDYEEKDRDEDEDDEEKDEWKEERKDEKEERKEERKEAKEDRKEERKEAKEDRKGEKDEDDEDDENNKRKRKENRGRENGRGHEVSRGRGHKIGRGRGHD